MTHYEWFEFMSLVESVLMTCVYVESCMYSHFELIIFTQEKEIHDSKKFKIVSNIIINEASEAIELCITSTSLFFFPFIQATLCSIFLYLCIDFQTSGIINY